MASGALPSPRPARGPGCTRRGTRVLEHFRVLPERLFGRGMSSPRARLIVRSPMSGVTRAKRRTSSRLASSSASSHSPVELKRLEQGWTGRRSAPPARRARSTPRPPPGRTGSPRRRPASDMIAVRLSRARPRGGAHGARRPARLACSNRTMPVSGIVLTVAIATLFHAGGDQPRVAGELGERQQPARCVGCAPRRHRRPARPRRACSPGPPAHAGSRASSGIRSSSSSDHPSRLGLVGVAVDGGAGQVLGRTRGGDHVADRVEGP